ncbi:MAG: cytochrome b/b6 domain-containing protein [gamma proteobacterium symbiont of Bathyaustriella thionipta]|nr:cytochrome b/b6 domain-containing protein [gamma proteobacterium symbiont of Bathyaustriella thionipta]
MSDRLLRKKVWSKSLRLAHWGLAFSTLALLLSGFMVATGTAQTVQAYDFWINSVHMGAAPLLLLSLLLRAVLLIKGGVESRLSAMLRSVKASALVDMLKFYITLGKAPLPAYFAHNPLWVPLFIGFLLLLLLQALLGVLLYQDALRQISGLSLDSIFSLHQLLAPWILGFVMAHILLLFLHDWRGKRFEISAMLHGDKIFTVNKPEAIPGQPVSVVVQPPQRSASDD